MYIVHLFLLYCIHVILKFFSRVRYNTYIHKYIIHIYLYINRLIIWKKNSNCPILSCVYYFLITCHQVIISCMGLFLLGKLLKVHHSLSLTIFTGYVLENIISPFRLVSFDRPTPTRSLFNVLHNAQSRS